MTQEQELEVINLVKQLFIEGEVDEDGYTWIEYAGTLDVFLKFADVLLNKNVTVPLVEVAH